MPIACTALHFPSLILVGRFFASGHISVGAGVGMEWVLLVPAPFVSACSNTPSSTPSGLHMLSHLEVYPNTHPRPAVALAPAPLRSAAALTESSGLSMQNGVFNSLFLTGVISPYFLQRPAHNMSSYIPGDKNCCQKNINQTKQLTCGTDTCTTVNICQSTSVHVVRRGCWDRYGTPRDLILY